MNNGTTTKGSALDEDDAFSIAFAFARLAELSAKDTTATRQAVTNTVRLIHYGFTLADIIRLVDGPDGFVFEGER